MKKFVVVLLSALVAVSSLFSQSTKDEEFKKNGEIYFRFEISETKDIAWITKLISIDNVKEKTVFAYANEKEMNEFEAMAIPFTLLPHPNEGFKPVMKDYEELKGTDAWDAYPTYDAYVTMMNAFETSYPGICDVFSIGTTINGRQLLVAKISDNVSTDEAEPEFFYTSTMHGDETTGYVLMLRLIDSLLTAYSTSPRIANLVNNIEIYINPLANPDGTYKTGNNSVAGAVRYNANNIDLNRNFPDIITGIYANTQPETYAFMAFAESRNFVMSANIHGGAEVCNYPWDRKAALCADDSWWQYVCHEYADTAQAFSPSGYMTFLNDGITNGYAWYTTEGCRQDYMNFFHQCREFTLEISNTKLPAASTLPAFWGYNKRSFLNYIEQCTFGIRGMVTDAASGLPVQAEIFVLSHDIVGDSSWVYTSPLGNYHRLLNTGSYNVRVSAPCFETQVLNNVLVQNKIATVLNVQLIPDVDAVDFTANNTNISVGGAVSFTDLSCGNPTSWLWNISGPGTPLFISGTSSASQNPVVQFNTAGSYTVSLAVTGAGGTYTQTKTNFINVINCTFNTLPFTESFSGTTLPNCWSQVDNQGNGQVWQFGTISGYTPNPILTGNYAYLNSDAYGSSSSQNADLITPTLNLTGYSSVNLSFQHYYRHYTGSSATLSYSINGGTSWTTIQTWTASTSNPVTFNQIIAAISGQSNVKFRWKYIGSYAWYWAVDNLNITGTPLTLPPVANFSANNTAPFIGQTVNFTDLSTNTPTSWAWSFNPATITYTGGTSSAYQNPQVIFNTGGSYSVTLIATNASGSDPETKTNYIAVVYAPVANFLGSNLSPCIGETVSLTDLSANAPSSWTWSFNPATITYTSDTDSSSQNPQVQFNASGNYTIELIATNGSGSDSEIKMDYISVQSFDFFVDLKVMLEGSFNGTDMNTYITLLNEFPLSQPYSGSPWYYPGTENVTSIPTGVVDWVIVELRDATDAATATAATRISQQAAFVLSDGSVVDMDGISNLQFTNSIIHQLFVVIWHRNHLSVLSANSLVKTGETYSYDFTSDANQAFGIDAQKFLLNGIYGMIGGDANADGIIDDPDKDISWYDEAGKSGYLPSDLNLDGQSGNQDKNDFWLPNTGKGSQLP